MTMLQTNFEVTSKIFQWFPDTYFERLVEEVLGTEYHAPDHRDLVAKHVQAKDECVQLKQGLLAVVLDQQLGLGLVLQMEQAEPIHTRFDGAV